MEDGDNPPIGILLCTQKDHALVEYALAGMDNQLFVSKYQLHLPEREQLQRELERTLRGIMNPLKETIGHREVRIDELEKEIATLKKPR